MLGAPSGTSPRPSSVRGTAARCPARARPRRRAAARARCRCARGPRPVSAASVSARWTANEPFEHAVLLGQRLVEPAVLDRHRALSGERARQRDLDRRELARPPAADVERADDLLAGEHRAAQHRADALAEDRVADPRRRRRALARVVGHRHRRAGRDHHAADAVAEREPHAHERLGARADRDAHVERRSDSLTSPIHARSVPSNSRARSTISCSVGVDVGLGGLDLHADLDERLVGRRSAAPAPRPSRPAARGARRTPASARGRRRAGRRRAQVGDERAAHRRRRIQHRLDAVDQATRATPCPSAAAIHSGARSAACASLMPVGGDHASAVGSHATAQ